MTTSPLCPIRQHPELVGFDDDGLQLFADVLGVELYQNWDGSPATTEEDAWRIRQHLNAERIRQAEAYNARMAQAEAEDLARRAPVPLDQFRAWDERATAKADYRFAKTVQPPEVDLRSPLERLKAKVQQ